MVQMIIGNNGKGKSKVLLEKVNNEIKEILGNIVFVDTTSKHMYELNNKIRLINGTEYIINNSDMFIGFISGIISQDHDLQQMYFDNFLKLADTDVTKLPDVIKQLELVSEKFGVDFYLSVSTSNGDIPDCIKDRVLVAL